MAYDALLRAYQGPSMDLSLQTETSCQVGNHEILPYTRLLTRVKFSYTHITGGSCFTYIIQMSQLLSQISDKKLSLHTEQVLDSAYFCTHNTSAKHVCEQYLYILSIPTLP